MVCCWFCLWVISSYFILDHGLAVLFCPFALRLGVTLHSTKALWPVIYSAEIFLIIVLAAFLGPDQWVLILSASVVSIPLLWLASEHYYGSQWRRLCVMATLIFTTAIISGVIVAMKNGAFGMAVLTGISGGLMVVPACYLVWHYLFQSQWLPLTAKMARRPIRFYSRNLFFYSMLFLINIAIQLGLPEEMRRFAPFFLAVPIVLLAFRYGWRGAFLGTLLNSVALIAARSGDSRLVITDLLLSLSAQSLTGILLGAGIQQLRELNSELRRQLKRNRLLSQHLVTAEESVRRDIARELHDEIGQNITAIRMQAGLLKRLEKTPAVINSANMIESVSLNIYDTTKRLLTRLRPKALDDVGLKEAIEQLVWDLDCRASGIEVTIRWHAPTNIECALSDAMLVTVYRICQEALNNVIKYADASQVVMELTVEDTVCLTISDNGVGFDPSTAAGGFGLLGMSERVEALGGAFTVKSSGGDQCCGTQLFVSLPRTRVSV